MKRVLVIGCGGSGKSTFSRILSEKIKLPVIHLDKLFWKEGCPERFDLDFMIWIWNFNKTHRANFYNILKEEKDKDIYIFKNRKECNNFLVNLQ